MTETHTTDEAKKQNRKGQDRPRKRNRKTEQHSEDRETETDRGEGSEHPRNQNGLQDGAPNAETHIPTVANE